MKTLISKFLIRRGFNRLVKQIGRLNNRKMSAEETIDFLFSKDAELIQPWQFREEILGLAKEIEALNPKVVVEIGTANGGTLFVAGRLAADDATLVSIDLPGGKFGGGYPEWKVPIYKSFGRPGQKIELIRGNSHAPETFEQLKKYLDGKQIDYLFIDGDHTYEGVKKDFLIYSPLVRNGGKIGFHDVVVHKGSACNVYEFWNEVKTDYTYKEYINDPNQNQFGVGLIEYDHAWSKGPVN